MQDRFGRTINYLRLALTEACNFRCPYCAPGGHSTPSASPLSVGEIEAVVRAALNLGIMHVRLTGGEPLLRRDILEIVRAIRSVEGIQDLSLTTNGFFLEELAHPLADAGLTRVTVSLDSLHRERFAEIVGTDAFDRVWRGIQAAEQAGLAPLKLNVVVLRGINDDEISDLARLTVARPWQVRFIELMPVGNDPAAQEYFARRFMPIREVQAHLPELEPAGAVRGNGPARVYHLPGARGTLGFITPMSDHFCAACNRIRVTARGEARSCLFGEAGANLRPSTSEGVTAVEPLLVRAILSKPERHSAGGTCAVEAAAMSAIGG
jgi:GTP 3',8-cyclase